METIEVNQHYPDLFAVGSVHHVFVTIRIPWKYSNLAITLHSSSNRRNMKVHTMALSVQGGEQAFMN